MTPGITVRSGDEFDVPVELQMDETEVGDRSDDGRRDVL
jgi:hypothetical protein